MLDIKYILENTQTIRDNIKKRNVTADIDGLLERYAERKALMLTLENKRAEANQIAKAIPTMQQADKAELINKGRALNHEITLLEKEVTTLDEAYNEAMLSIPNLLADDTPLGETDAENLVLRTNMTPREFDFEPRDHVQIGKALDLIDFDSGAKVTGSKFYFLKNEAVLLELALKLFAMKIAASFGYTTLITPDLAKKSVLCRCGGVRSNIVMHVTACPYVFASAAKQSSGFMRCRARTLDCFAYGSQRRTTYALNKYPNPRTVVIQVSPVGLTPSLLRRLLICTSILRS